MAVLITEKISKIRRRRPRKQGDAGCMCSTMMRCMGATAVMLNIYPSWWMRTYPDVHGQTAASFTLILRTRDQLMFAPAALKHYSECPNVGAIRVVKEVGPTWNLTRANIALKTDWQGELGGLENLKDVLVDAGIASVFVDLMEARPAASGAAFLVSDDFLVACEDVSSALETWSRHTNAIVGTIRLGHILRPESGEHAWLDYTVSQVTEKHGLYSMLSLNGAFLHTGYLRQAEERLSKPERPGLGEISQMSAECDEIWLNHEVSLSVAKPLIRVITADRPSYLSTSSIKYYKTMSRCLSLLASTNGGKLDLHWTQDVSESVPGAKSTHQNELTNPIQRFLIKDDALNRRRKYQIRNERVAGVTAILVMGTKPNEMASAVRHLHASHAFIHEAVVWNNKNETMNHHMFPYDIPLRYVMARRNYSAYSRFLGCILARYEICYFQHVRNRPRYVAGLYAAFLMRPDVIVAASSPLNALVMRTNMTFSDTSTGRLSGFADLEDGAMVHKDLVRQFVDRMSLDDSRSFHERAADADLYFTYSQPRLPMILTHTTWNNNRAREFPKLHRIGKALAFTFNFAPSSKPLPGFDDALSQRHKHYKAICVKSRCAFATSINAWPSPVAIDMEHDKATLKPTRYYANLIETSISRSNSTQQLDSTNNYAFAVDGDLTTFWQARLPSKQYFISLELLAASIIVGIKLWCRNMFDPIPTLQLGYYGKSGFLNDRICVAKWTTDGALKLVHYTCPPVRVHRVRLVIAAVDQNVDIAEFAVEKLDSDMIRAAHAFALHQTYSSPDNTTIVPVLSNIGRIVYILQGNSEDYCTGEKLAMLEEACEIGALYPGKIQLLYVGNSPKMSLQSLAFQFAVVGSTCDFAGSLVYETVPMQSKVGEENRTTSRDVRKARLIDVYEWWVRSRIDAQVVFFDPHESQLMLVLRNKRAIAPNTVFVARSSHLGDVDEGLSLADATTVSSKADYILQAQGSTNWGQDRRISYPLRTLRNMPPLLETPTTPAIEEVIILLTQATTPEDMELFNRNALLVLQKHADVRLANISSLQRDFSGNNNRHPEMRSDAHIKAPKWRTLRDVVRYVSLYPARVLWILDASPGSAYFASFASVEGARFVAAPAAIPHSEPRILAWNATCEWTPEGFEGKTVELLRGRFNMSSGFMDREHLHHDAPNIIVEEWPIKRMFSPFANPVADVARYLAELHTMATFEK